MNRGVVVAVLAGMALAGCQGVGPATPPTVALQEDLTRLRAERDAGRISYTEWAERTGTAARASVALTPEQEQAIAYRSQLARRVDAGEITPSQFEVESVKTLRRLKARPS